NSTGAPSRRTCASRYPPASRPCATTRIRTPCSPAPTAPFMTPRPGDATASLSHDRNFRILRGEGRITCVFQSRMETMNSRSASHTGNLLDELQSTLRHGTVARRVETLRRVTDLFLGGAVDYSDEQVALFDDVFKCLIDHIEVSARTLLANRLAPLLNAPRDTIRML